MPSGTFLDNIQAWFGWYTGQEPFPEGRMDEVTMPRRKGEEREFCYRNTTQSLPLSFRAGEQNLSSFININVLKKASSQIADFVAVVVTTS